MTEKKKNQKKAGSEVKTFNVKFDLVEINESITITTHTPSIPSKEKIINQAFKFHSQGNISKASEYYQYLINNGSIDPRLFLNYSVICKNTNKINKAIDLLKKSIKLHPNFPDSYTNLGNIYRDIKKLEESVFYHQEAIKINPNYENAYNNLANTYRDMGRLNESKECTNKAIEINPNFAIGYLNLSIILLELGKPKEAEFAIRKCIQINPNLAYAHSTLGNLLNLNGNSLEAEIEMNKAIKINSKIAEFHSDLIAILRKAGKLKTAEKAAFKAISLNPNLASTYHNLGKVYFDQKKYSEAKKYRQIATEKEPSNLLYFTNNRLRFSSIMKNQEQITQERNEFIKSISHIKNNKNLIFNPKELPATNIFYLAYHNCNDDKAIALALSESLSSVEGIINKSFDHTKAIIESKKRKKIRLGICCDFLYNHSVSNCYDNIIKDIANSGIEVILFKRACSYQDSTSKAIETIISKTIILPESIDESAKLILNHFLDILFYPEVGMSNYTYLLSLSRLALVQVLGGGHPNTSGSPSMDYYISSKYLETEKSDKYYSERLIRLNRLPVNYTKPKFKESNFTRSNLNLSKNEFLIGLTHTLFKYHHDFDIVLDKILEEIPNAKLLFFAGKENIKTKHLINRWKENTKLILNRSIIHPFVNFDKYMTIIKTVDIILDPFYFGMGNTFYQAMSLGIPVVTLPSTQQRGRVVFAGYKQMGIKNPPQANSSEEYILICKKLAFNNSYKEDIKHQILTKSKEKLFNDKSIFKQYITFFKESINAAQKRELLPSKWEP